MQINEDNKSGKRCAKMGLVLDHIKVVLIESLKFTLLAILSFIIIGTSLIYLFLDVLKIDREISIMVVGIITAIIIVVVDNKKLYTRRRIFDSDCKILHRLIHRR